MQGAVPVAQPAAMAVPAGQAYATPSYGQPAYGQPAPVPVAQAVALPYNPSGASTGGLYPAVPLATAVAYPAK